MKILLTGHMGFIGSYLYNFLCSEKCIDNGALGFKHQVIGLDLKNHQDLTFCDLNYDVDVVIHLAGLAQVRESLKNPTAYWDVNVLASKRLFDAFPNTRIIYASSSSAYEPEKNPYAFSKFALDKIAPAHSLGLRFTTVWCEGGRDGMFMTKLFNNDIKYVTEHTRDFIHVDDVVSAIDLLMTKNITGVIDVGTGISNSLKTLADLAGIKNYENKYGSMYERLDNRANIKELRDLGWEPKVNVIDYIKNKYHLTS
jgi:nucleoside-diphosphate-sugar epimerase